MLHPTIKQLVHDLENEESDFDCGLVDISGEYRDNFIKVETRVENSWDPSKPALKVFTIMVVMWFLNFIDIGRWLPELVYIAVAAVTSLSILYFGGKLAVCMFKTFLVDGGSSKAGGESFSTLLSMVKI